MSYRKYLMTDDVPPSELYKTVKIDTDSDTISRAKAIDALGDMPEGDDDFDTGCRQQWNWDTEAIKALPSAQPEIIRCRECKFASGDSRICMKFDHSPIGELDFCAWAEMREVTT